MDRIKRLIPFLVLVFLLTSCAKTVKFTVTFDTEDAARRTELEAAIGRIVEGRLVSKGKNIVNKAITTSGDANVLTVRVSDVEAAKLLNDGLTSPFTMAIMKQVAEGQGDIISEKFGEFKETGIATKHFDWVAPVLSATDAGSSKGAVVIKLTQKGQELLKDIFAKNRGDVIAIFVRGQLMSKKLVNGKDKQDSIQIDGIPSAELAQAFADDVNVGLHATFAPVR